MEEWEGELGPTSTSGVSLPGCVNTWQNIARLREGDPQVGGRGLVCDA